MGFKGMGFLMIVVMRKIFAG